jgi:Fur family ferric uptake transcriptional regulator
VQVLFDEQMARFRDRLADRGLRLTGQREAIAEVFFRSGRHLSLSEILELALAQRPGIGFATVYRTMRMLVDLGFADENRFGEDQTLYEPALAGEHHDHFICVDCGKIVEFEDPQIEDLQTRAASRHGFEVVSHRHEVYVRCVEDCGQRPGSQAALVGAV